MRAEGDERPGGAEAPRPDYSATPGVEPDARSPEDSAPAGGGLAPDVGAVRRFLELLRPGGPWHVCANAGGRFSGAVLDDLDAAVKWVADRNRGRQNTYVTLAEVRPGFRGDKPKKQDIARTRWLWVDVDPPAAGDPAVERGRILSRLRGMQPKPHVVLDSGGGYWGLWRLTDPLELPDPGSPDWDAARAAVEDRNRRLEQAAGGDSCHNIERVARIAGTVNWPSEKKQRAGRVPALARVVDAEDDRLPPDAFPRLAAGGGSCASSGSGGNSATASLDGGRLSPGEVEQLRRQVGDRVMALVVNGEDPDDPGRWADRSDLVFHVACEMVRAGVTGGLAVRVLLDPDLKVSAHVLDQKGDRRRYAQRQVDRARGAVEREADAPPDPAADFSRYDSGKPHNTPQNIRLALAKLGVRVSHDRFADRLLVEGLAGFGPVLGDAALLRLGVTCEERFGLAVGPQRFCDIVMDTARRAGFHPLLDYLDGLRWDGVPRLDGWLSKYAGAEDTPYTRAVGNLLLVAAVRRARKPGCKFDEMLVLQSPQGGLKSSALRVLAGGDDWFVDHFPLTAKSKEVIEQARGKWIVEVAELLGARRADIDAMKAMLSRTHDRARPAYGRVVEEVPRSFVLVGTTNDDRFLRDTTGNRRFWPVRVGTFDLEALRRDRNQLWAEAAAREAAGVPIRLDPSLYAAAAAEQDKRTVDDPMLDLLRDVLGEDEAVRVTCEDVRLALGIGGLGATQEHMKRMGDAVRKLGFERKLMWAFRKMRQCYVRGEGGPLVELRRGDDGRVTRSDMPGHEWAFGERRVG